jgi:hypothetical protein
MQNVDSIALAAQYWFGYGRWDAPYWFIGPEPGRAKSEGDNLSERCWAWLDVCSNDPESGGLIDAYEHHKKFGYKKFFDRTPDEKHVPTQATWRQLIRLLLAYEGRPDDTGAVADYQATKWGRKDGETCVVEMSALAMNTLGSKQDLRERFRADRIAVLRNKIASNKPKFVVMYGGGTNMRLAWQAIACANDMTDCYVSEEIGGFDTFFTVRDGSAFALARHPVSHGSTDAYWVGLGRRLREKMLGRQPAKGTN